MAAAQNAQKETKKNEKIAHNIKCRLFCYTNTEDHSSTKECFISFFPFDVLKEKLFEQDILIGFDEEQVMQYTVLLNKQRHMKQLLETIHHTISEQTKKTLRQQLDSRLDDDLHFFIRFDKEQFLSDHRLELTDSGACLHIEINVACFPKKKEVAKQLLLSSLLRT